MPRKPHGFTQIGVQAGILLLREKKDGSWVILAADPPIKVDNAHDDRIPHMHISGWNSDIRRDLRPTLTASIVVSAIETHLEEYEYIDVEALLEGLR